MVTTVNTNGISEETRKLRDQAEDFKRIILTGCKTWIQVEMNPESVDLDKLSNDLAQHIAGNLVFALQLENMRRT